MGHRGICTDVFEWIEWQTHLYNIRIFTVLFTQLHFKLSNSVVHATM